MNEAETHSMMRLLDANANRAREGIRVLEDHARFILDDATLVQACKDLRHELQKVLSGHLGSALVRCRDTAGDVGTVLTHAAEQNRECIWDVLAAAGGRLGEALRNLEEYGKLLSPEAGQHFKSLRYQSYIVSSRLARRIGPVHRLKEAKLCVLLTASLCRDDWLSVAQSALEGGADIIQLREKQLDDRECLRRAISARALCDRHGALLIVNDRPDIAVAAKADGVHLGQEDIPVAAARRIMGSDRIVGLSTHSHDQVLQALEESPDYLAVGPMFTSQTKPQLQLAGPELLRQARECTSLPLVAIGGITCHNAESLKSADMLAVCGAVIGQSDVRAATEKLRGAFVRSKV